MITPEHVYLYVDGLRRGGASLEGVGLYRAVAESFSTFADVCRFEGSGSDAKSGGFLGLLHERRESDGVVCRSFEGVGGDATRGGNNGSDGLGTCGDVQTESGGTGSDVGSGTPPVCGGSSVDVVSETDCFVGVTMTRNKSLREKRKRAKARKRVVSRVCNPSEDDVPEWRRGAKGLGSCDVSDRRSRFASCSEEVQRELADTHAKSLIARNKADVLRSEEQARIVAARMKAGVPERRVEKQRIELNTKLVPLVRQQQVHERGFVEAGSVASSLGTMPSLSPDDSISVSDRIKMEEANAELRRRLEAVEVQNGELRIELRDVRNGGGVMSSLQRMGKFGTISFKEECEALESILDSKRDPMEDASHACDEDCIEDCWKYDRDGKLRPEYQEY